VGPGKIGRAPVRLSPPYEVSEPVELCSHRKPESKGKDSQLLKNLVVQTALASG
jgi:hypothetical protein